MAEDRPSSVCRVIRPAALVADSTMASATEMAALMSGTLANAATASLLRR
jgi:hypothetical protein